MTEPLVDQMDAGLDIFRVCRIPLRAEGWIDQDAVDAISLAEARRAAGEWAADGVLISNRTGMP